ncbi:MAG TPA: polysaccharide biosynthesis tyrosine autokinase [bacterium]|nr:polysaccharide biosynthesis tyrosine autokinase [bacterium]HQG44593.1 polysaccharide biosynthesis tyrosine autokinase [bacterium]HQI47812.1 polysaccharide biosynthesis tyrosine autokinase [bacterium]HQJ65435.1 polysaccharide biosynthesis tyrosine autokinase [bacterium]
MNHPSAPSTLSGGSALRLFPPPRQERQLTVHDYFRILYRGRWVILISFLSVLAATLYYTFTAEPKYEASAKIMVEQQGGVGQSLFDFSTMMKKETMINNQVEILKSRTLAENVLQSLRTSEPAARLRLLGAGGESGRGLFKEWFGKGGAPSLDDPRFFDLVTENLRKQLSIAPIRNTDMIEIRVTAPSPFEAAFVTNAVAQAYKEMNRAQSQSEVRQVKNFIEEQMSKVHEELARSEEELKSYQQQAKVVALDRETEELVRKTAEFETIYNEAATDLEAHKQRLAYINQQLAQRNVNFDVETISTQPYLAEMKKQIAEKEAALASYMASMIEIGAYERNKSEVQLRERQVEALKQKFRDEIAKIAAAEFVDPAQLAGTLFSNKIEVETEIQSLIPKVEALKGILAGYNRELESLPQKSLTLARLLRAAQVDEKIYLMLQEKYQESRITEVGQIGNVRIIDAAREPKKPVSPRKGLNLILGTIAGLGLGLAIAFTLEYLDNSVRTMEDVEHLGMTVMASIPFIKAEPTNGVFARGLDSKKDAEVRSINERLVTQLKPRSPISEAYRTLRTNILFSTPGQPKKLFLVTSSGPQEGKSTTVANLAITFAQMGNRTLLIDADLRKPIQHRLFGLEKSSGLTNILVGRAELDESTHEIEVLPELHVLSCGVIPPNPAELLGSEAMQRLLTAVRDRYSIVLIDSPPTLAVTDAAILAPMVDGVLLVIRSGDTAREAAVRAHEQLKRVGAPVLGAILNGITAEQVYGSYYPHYYYSDYYREKNKSGKPGSRSAENGKSNGV